MSFRLTESQELACKRADRVFFNIIAAVFVAMMVGAADWIVNIFFESKVRKELGWFDELVYDLTGPVNFAKEFRDSDFWGFVAFSGFWAFFIALAISFSVVLMSGFRATKPNSS